MQKPVYTEPDNCQDCYKCIRECPVKAIRIENNKADILDDRCVYCGHCTQVCPTGAKKIRDDLTRAQLTLRRHRQVFLSLAPSYVSEFENISSSTLISAIKALGFKGVSETALGAEVISAHSEAFLDSAGNDIHISSACPVVVEYIRKYACDYVPNITPLVSPMLAHAKILKSLFGDDIKIIFAGPCIGKKLEADTNSDLVDSVITFKDLKTWFEKEKIDLRDNVYKKSEEHFIPYRSKLGARYPVEGGMLEGLHKPAKNVTCMAFSDLPTIKDIFKNITPNSYDDPIFLELLACKGGCINGPAKLSSLSPAIKRYEVIQQSNLCAPVEDFTGLDMRKVFNKDNKVATHEYSEEEIKQALATVGKTSPEDELNCSSCGYDSCRDFAVALLENRAEDNMCASYMRRIAHDKATVLLHKIPAGVLLVNADLKVVDMNLHCAQLLGEEIVDIYDVCAGLTGVSLNAVCSFETFFRTVLETGREIKERHIRENEKTWILSIFNIQQHRLVFGLLKDLQDPDVQKEWIIEKTKEVIKHHMSTAQKVAGLLGENAAFTDATLRAVIDAYNLNQKEKNI